MLRASNAVARSSLLGRVLYHNKYFVNHLRFIRVCLAWMWQKTLRQLGGGLASDAGVIDLRAVAFWSLAKRERLWAEDEVRTTWSRINKYM